MKMNPIEIIIPVTKYERWKSSLMASTTPSRAMGPEASAPATSSWRSGVRGSGGDRKKEAAIPSSSDPYHASLSTALSDWESSRSGGDVGRLALHWKLQNFGGDWVDLCRKCRKCGVREEQRKDDMLILWCGSGRMLDDFVPPLILLVWVSKQV